MEQAGWHGFGFPAQVLGCSCVSPKQLFHLGKAIAVQMGLFESAPPQTVVQIQGAQDCIITIPIHLSQKRSLPTLPPILKHLPTYTSKIPALVELSQCILIPSWSPQHVCVPVSVGVVQNSFREFL